MARRGSGTRRTNGEGTIYWDAKRERYVGAAYIDGRRRKVVAKTEKEAKQRLRELITADERGDTIGDGNATVADALDLWERRVLASRDIAPATRDVYEWCVRVIRAEIGSRRLRTLKVDDVEDMLDRLADPKRKPDPTTKKATRPLSRSALVKVRSVLGQVLDTAERRQLVNRNVARIAELTPSALRPVDRRSFTPDQARKFRKQLEQERLGAMFLLAMTTAVRPGEAAGVLWDDLDLKKGVMHVRHAVRLEGARPVVTDELKTSGSYRSIDLPAVTVAALKRHRKAQSEEELAATKWLDDAGLVFTTRNGTPLSPSNVRRELRDICERAEVPDITPNELRHTAASLMSDAGVPLERIADAMGHESTRMLDKTYRHRVRASVDAAVIVMDDLFAEDAS